MNEPRETGSPMPPTPPTPPARPTGPTPPRPARRPLPSPLAVITATLGLFFVVLTLMAIQVRNGRDPALGPGPAVAKTAQPAKGAKAAAKGATATRAKQAAQIVTQTSPTHP